MYNRAHKFVGMLIKRRLALAALTLVCLFFILLETGLYVVSSFPDALRDLMLNQRLVPITSISHTQFQFSEAGRLEMKDAKVSFVGVGRGIAALDMKSILIQLEMLSGYFKETQYILVIENSEPSTVSELLKWSDKNHKNRKVIFTVPAPDTSHEALPREGRISLARNTALDAYRKSAFDADYIIAFDVDVLGWDIGGVQDSFGQKDRWDAVCSHGIILHGLYRDVYAFRTQGLNTNHHLSGDDHLLYNISASQRADHRRTLMRSKRRIHSMMDGRGDASGADAEGAELLRLDSCFGGMAVYKVSALQGCDYSYRHTAAPHVVDCEHVLFHKCLRERNNARIVSNRHMKLWYGHTSFRELNLGRVWHSLVELMSSPSR